MKKCSKCRKRKRRASDSWCGPCRKDYAVAQRIKSIRAKLLVVNRLKADPCMDCGGSFKPWIMQFDHRDGEIKMGDVSYLIYRNSALKRILDEIKKCDLVCANCHANRTHVRRVNNGSSIYDEILLGESHASIQNISLAP